MDSNSEATVQPAQAGDPDRAERLARRRAMAAGAAAIAVAAGMLAPHHEARASSGSFDSSTTDPAVRGDNSDGGPGVLGTSVDGTGVRGQSTNAPGVRGDSVNSHGVRGSSTTGNGMRAVSDQGNGIRAEHTSTTVAGNAVRAINAGLGGGVSASAVNGTALFGDRPTGSGGDSPAVAGQNGSAGPAVLAVRQQTASDFNGAVEALNFAAGPGIHGVGQNGEGVVGERRSDATGLQAAIFGINLAAGSGVHGRAITRGAGVRGEAPGEAPAVQASSGTADATGFHLDGGLALLVDGQSVLRGTLSAQVGSGTIAVGEFAHAVSDAAAKTTSHVSVMLAGPSRPDNENGIAVSWIERAAGSFNIHLTARPTLNVPFTYTVVNPS